MTNYRMSMKRIWYSDHMLPEDYSPLNGDNDFLVKKEGESQGQYEDRVVRQYLRFAMKFTLKFSNYLDGRYDDYLQEACIGLIKAIRSFDHNKEVKFITYASRCMTNEILMYKRKEDNLGITGISKYQKLQAQIKEVIEGREHYSIDELAQSLGTSIEDINLSMNARNPIISLNSFISGSYSDSDDGIRLEEVLQSSENIENDYEVRDMLSRALELINKIYERSSNIKREIYQIIIRSLESGEDLQTQAEISKKLGISQSYVSRIIKSIQEEVRETITYCSHESKEILKLKISSIELKQKLVINGVVMKVVGFTNDGDIMVSRRYHKSPKSYIVVSRESLTLENFE